MREEMSEDKSFAQAMKMDMKKGLPHCEWDGTDFVPTRPKPSPKVKVNVTLMHAAHKKFGCQWEGSRKGTYKSHTVEAVADSGCQTSSAGMDILEQIGCPEPYLVPTSHRIVGITDSFLDIVGSVFLRIEVAGKITRQMVHVSRNTRGLYLSETALSQLGLVHEEFPHPRRSRAQLAESIMCVGIVSPPENSHTSAPGDVSNCGEGTNVPCVQRTSTPDRPEKIPIVPSKENAPKLKRWLLWAFRSSGFNICSHQLLQGMEGNEMDVVFKDEEAPPRAYAYTPIPVPHHWKKKVKSDMDGDVRLGVIEKVPQGDTSRWCSRMVVAPKANGKPRRTVDLQQLNKATVREVHHTPSPINLVSTIPAGKLKTVLDAWNGYHSLELSPKGRAATTFITEWGRYRYCRGPQGFHGTGDAYTRRFDDITANEVRYVRCVDDGCLWDEDVEQAFWHTFDHIKMCADKGVVFNPEKFRFAEETVEFAGFDVTMDGYRPAERTLAAIKDFPTPCNITDIRSWFGLVNQVAYTFAQHHTMDPFRELMKKNRKFYWDDNLEQLFQTSKKEIVRQAEEGVRAYDLQKQTCLTTDWCKTGVGFALTQKHCKCSGPANPNCGEGHWKLVFAGSRFTKKNERDLFSPTEGECLAVAFGLSRCRMFTLGCPNLTLAVDHRPLLGILNDRALDTIENPRLLKLKEKTLPYTFRVTYVPGSSNAIRIADALSRHPTNKGLDGDEGEEDISDIAQAFAIQQTENVESISWRKVAEAAAIDKECTSLVRCIIDGFPDDKGSLPDLLKPYWGFKDELYVIDTVPFKGRKMLIPSILRPSVLDGLHAANQGVTGMLSNARDRLFWPGLDASIRLLRQQCRQCNEQAPSQSAEPCVFSPQPRVPFEQVAADLCSLGGHAFFVYADRFSGWVEVEHLSTNTFRQVRQVLLRWFRTYGVPDEIATDGGPPFKSLAYEAFLKSWDIRPRLSSAYFPQSNGRAEAAVKSIKRILLGNINQTTGELDTDAAARAIMTHRNTPAQDTGISPSVMLFGKPLRDHLPRFNRKLRPEWDSIGESREEALARRISVSSLRPKTELQSLTIGDAVQVQNQKGNHPNKWNCTGIVAEVLPNRQYHVVMDGSRRVSLRNRRFLKKISPVSRRSVDNDVAPPHTPEPQETPPVPPISTPLSDTPNALPNHPDIEADRECMQQSERDATEQNEREVIPSPQTMHTEPTRKSNRERAPRKLFTARMDGKYHS